MNTTADRFQSSPLQEALWLAQPDGPTGATQLLLTRAGGFAADAVQDALRSSVERHEILRTTFIRQAGVRVPLQAVHGTLEPGWATDSGSVQEVAERELATAFDLESGPLVRAVLAGAGDDQALVLTASALVADASSLAVLAQELSTALGGGGTLVEEPLQYADYAAWQHELADGTEPERQTASEFWREAADASAPAVAFADVAAAPGAPQWVGVPLDDSAAPGLAAVAARYGTTEAAVVFAGWLALLGRGSGEENVTAGWITAERRHADLEGAVGAFSRPVPVTVRTAGVTFAEVLQEVQRATQRALVVQDYAPTDGTGNLPVGFISEATAAGPVSGRTRTRPGAQPRLWVAAADGGAVSIGFDRDYLDTAHAEQLASRLGTLLAGIAANPGASVASLPQLDQSARDQVLSQFAEGPAPAEGADQPVHVRVAAWAAREPARIAAADEHGTLTYGELDAQAGRLAARLARAGVTAGDTVGLCTDRSREMVVGLLGILKAGAAYVPLHHEHPKARLAHQLSTADVKAIVTQEPLLEHLPEFSGEVICLDRDAESLAAEEPLTGPEVGGEQLAYVIYTSGSTGTPKGVGVTHANLANYASAITDRLDAAAEPLSFGLVTAISTDLGNTSVFGALVSGGTLVLVSPLAAADAGALVKAFQATPVDVLKITPSHIGSLLSGGDTGVLPRRWLVIGGERAAWDTVERVRSLAPELRILNHYGPTEATVGAVAHEVDDASREHRPGTVPIGRPLGGAAVYVLDEERQPVPVGVPGTLFIAGAGVASGYVGQPELTAERFSEDPFRPGRRMYDTGDLVRWLPSGELEFIGRADEQVKIRGYRVEPAEVESALRSHPGVQDAVVIVQASPAGDARLVAYVGADGIVADRPSTEDLAAHVGEWVPEFMVPSAIVVLDSLPRTPSGKIDIQSLPDPADVAAPAEEFVAPRSPMEEAVAEIWTRVLGVPEVGVKDDFFSLGGHSLLATQVVAHIRTDFAIDLPLHSLFTHPTVETLTAEIVRAMGDSEGDATATLLAELEGLSDEDAERLLAGDESAE